MYNYSLQWLRSPKILLYLTCPQLAYYGRAWRPEDIWHSEWNSTISIFKQSFSTHWVRRVNAALVTDAGRLRPLMISRQIFLFITWQKKIKNTMKYFVPQWAEEHKKFWRNFSPLTSTSPPFSTTSLNSLNKSNVCFAIIGTLFTGVPENEKKVTKNLQTSQKPQAPAAVLNAGYTERREIAIRDFKIRNQPIIRGDFRRGLPATRVASNAGSRLQEI